MTKIFPLRMRSKISIRSYSYSGYFTGSQLQHIVTLPKYGHGELNIRRPHITDILRCSFRVSGRKMAERFQKVMTSQEHQTINNAVLY